MDWTCGTLDRQWNITDVTRSISIKTVWRNDQHSWIFTRSHKDTWTLHQWSCHQCSLGSSKGPHQYIARSLIYTHWHRKSAGSKTFGRICQTKERPSQTSKRRGTKSNGGSNNRTVREQHTKPCKDPRVKITN